MLVLLRKTSFLTPIYDLYFSHQHTYYKLRSFTNRAYFNLQPGGNSSLKQTPVPLATYSLRTIYIYKRYHAPSRDWSTSTESSSALLLSHHNWISLNIVKERFVIVFWFQGGGYYLWHTKNCFQLRAKKERFFVQVKGS